MGYGDRTWAGVRPVAGGGPSRAAPAANDIVLIVHDQRQKASSNHLAAIRSMLQIYRHHSAADLAVAGPRINSPPDSSRTTSWPGTTWPDRMASARRSCTSRWMTRLTGRAPNSGSQPELGQPGHRGGGRLEAQLLLRQRPAHLRQLQPHDAASICSRPSAPEAHDRVEPVEELRPEVAARALRAARSRARAPPSAGRRPAPRTRSSWPGSRSSPPACCGSRRRAPCRRSAGRRRAAAAARSSPRGAPSPPRRAGSRCTDAAARPR